VNERAIKAVREFLAAMGLDPDAAELKRTPERVANLFADLFSGLEQRTDDIWGELLPEGDGSLVAVRRIPFCSICEHHLMPFFGEINLVYLPSSTGVAGFGKFLTLAKILSRRPQLQERLTAEIAAAIMAGLSAKGVLVKIEAQQFCLLAAQEWAKDTKTVTTVAQGELKCGSPLYEAALSMLEEKNANV